ncbi:MAG: hypothetical protein HY286_01190 [Planctomycetes bacterium]|nr:hypothetical protein [Planctomycetota bacterium]
MSTDVPPSSLGLAFVGTAADGPDIFNIGDPVYGSPASPELFLIDFYSYASGFALAPAAIPNFPALAGSQYTVHAFWYWGSGPCSPRAIGVGASECMTFTIQP